MNGLILKPEWADLILSGEKPWEIRSCRTHQRGTICIIKSGSTKVFGTVEISACNQIDLKTFESNRYLHHIQPKSEYNMWTDRYKRYVWILRNPQIFENPIPYVHRQGAITWVKLPEDILEGVNL